MKHKVFIMDTGQMCNHIIVFGHAYGFCREHGLNPISLNFCLPQYQFFKICKTDICSRLWYYICKLLTKWIRLIPIINYNILDANNKENENKIKSSVLCLANGWCIRHYDLFEKYRNEIKELFSFNDDVAQSVDKTLSSTNKDTIKIGIHIRRGDYKQWCNGHYYFDDETYIDKINQIVRQLSDKDVIVYLCTNDNSINIEYFQNNLLCPIIWSKGNAAEDLCLLSKCDYVIGPPSTFSLVSALYGNNKIYWIKDSTDEVGLNMFFDFFTGLRNFDSYYLE